MHIGLVVGGLLLFAAAGKCIEFYLHRKVHPVCLKCGATLTEENTVPQDDDEDICYVCYAKEIAPDRYEFYFEDR
jgi:hypothetical protein